MTPRWLRYTAIVAAHVHASLRHLHAASPSLSVVHLNRKRAISKGDSHTDCQSDQQPNSVLTVLQDRSRTPTYCRAPTCRTGRPGQTGHDDAAFAAGPGGRDGRDAPLQSRAIVTADASEAMASDHPYREARGRDFTIAELMSSAPPAKSSKTRTGAATATTSTTIFRSEKPSVGQRTSGERRSPSRLR
jgi:hypothetical protein